jgi:ferritin-like metal-binding protein YciE
MADNARHQRKGVKMCKFLLDALDLGKLKPDEKDKLKRYFESRKEELQEQIANLDRAIDAVKR